MIDSDIFSSGGATAKMWTSTLAVKQYDIVRSPLNKGLYIRLTNGGATATDPALDVSNYQDLDNSQPVGSIRYFNNNRTQPTLIVENGKTYLATGNLVKITDYPTVPDSIITIGDYWGESYTNYIGSTSGANNYLIYWDINEITGVILGVSNTGVIWKCTDFSSMTFVNVGNAPGTNTSNYTYWSTALAVNMTQSKWYFSDSTGVIYVSSNDGASWTAKTKAYPSATYNRRIRYYNDTLYAFPTSTGSADYVCYRSLDDGATWNGWVSAGVLATSYYFVDMMWLKDANYKQFAFVQSEGSITITTDGGITWKTAISSQRASTTYIASWGFDGTNVFLGYHYYNGSTYPTVFCYLPKDGTSSSFTYLNSEIALSGQSGTPNITGFYNFPISRGIALGMYTGPYGQSMKLNPNLLNLAADETNLTWRFPVGYVGVNPVKGIYTNGTLQSSRANFLSAFLGQANEFLLSQVSITSGSGPNYLGKAYPLAGISARMLTSDSRQVAYVRIK